jgi:hypothetical protein
MEDSLKIKLEENKAQIASFKETLETIRRSL